jgi:hypothetical protein
MINDPTHYALEFSEYWPTFMEDDDMFMNFVSMKVEGYTMNKNYTVNMKRNEVNPKIRILYIEFENNSELPVGTVITAQMLPNK